MSRRSRAREIVIQVLYEDGESGPRPEAPIGSCATGWAATRS
jgi:hypothetical protein